MKTLEIRKNDQNAILDEEHSIVSRVSSILIESDH